MKHFLNNQNLFGSMLSYTIFMFIQINLIKWEENHRALDIYINKWLHKYYEAYKDDIEFKKGQARNTEHMNIVRY